jgi:hypothetical protein
MVAIWTFPSPNDLGLLAGGTPEFMRPNEVPFAALVESHLSDAQCDAILEALNPLEGYRHKGCDAWTREIAEHPSLDPIEEAARYLNFMYWEYVLDPGQYSWLQTYEKDQGYQRHADGRPGQMRKLTAVAMLSDENDYDGGVLRLHWRPTTFGTKLPRGSIVVFQPWVEHDVTPVTRGVRQTINMGFWGPPFK